MSSYQEVVSIYMIDRKMFVETSLGDRLEAYVPAPGQVEFRVEKPDGSWSQFTYCGSFIVEWKVER